MSSSDSEDDSFLNIAKKLSDLKKNCRLDDVDIMQNDSKPGVAVSTSPSKKGKSKKSPAKKAERQKSTDSGSSGSIDLDEFRSAFPPINEPKRRGRPRAVKRKSAQSSPNLAESQMCLPRRRKKNASENAGTSSNANLTDSTNCLTASTSKRGRGRGRGRARARGRNSLSSSISNMEGMPTIMDMLRSMIPVYSVGNTDEYPDQSDTQQLFGSRKADPVQEEVLDDTLEDNEELSVKVIWQSSDYFKFQIRQYQKITTIFEFFAKREKVSFDKLLFQYNDMILTQDDTPDSINYTVAKFIEGGIVNQSLTHVTKSNTTTDVKDGIKIKFQCQNIKKPFETYIKPDDKLGNAMMRCAEHFEKTLDKLRFEFDGDPITGKLTPKELELEGGECFDVKILS